MNLMVKIETTEAQTQSHKGKIKWFSNAKGFGFLTCSDYARDVLLHENVLGQFAGRALPIGTDVEFIGIEGKQGPRVTELVSMDLSHSEGIDALCEDVAVINLQSARVKWYDPAKGFGFANCFGKPDDIFLHSSVVDKYGKWDLREGEAICLRVKQTERGLIAIDVRPWDEATTEV